MSNKDDVSNFLIDSDIESSCCFIVVVVSHRVSLSQSHNNKRQRICIESGNGDSINCRRYSPAVSCWRRTRTLARRKRSS